MFFSRLFDGSSYDLAIDLGTANTVIYRAGYGVVVDEPSIVTVEMQQGLRSITATGREAKAMLGKTPTGMRSVWPISDGVIAHIEVAELMIKHFLDKARDGSVFRRRRENVLVTVPSGSTMVERRAIRDCVIRAGAHRVGLIEDALAAAIGAGLPVKASTGSMLIDIGAGTTEIAILSLGSLTYARSIRFGSSNIDDTIVSYVRRKHSLMIGNATAEAIKIVLGSAEVDGGEKVMDVRGRNQVLGRPCSVVLTESEISLAISEQLNQIAAIVRAALEQTPPEISADLIDAGIVLTGGGALLPGLAGLLSRLTSLPVKLAENPSHCAAIGAGMALKDEAYRSLFMAA